MYRTRLADRSCGLLIVEMQLLAGALFVVLMRDRIRRAGLLVTNRFVGRFGRRIILSWDDLSFYVSATLTFIRRPSLWFIVSCSPFTSRTFSFISLHPVPIRLPIPPALVLLSRIVDVGMQLESAPFCVL